MTARVIERDERTMSVENASYRWAFLLLSFGVLLSVAYRSFVLQQTAWDLMALVIVSGVVATGYQAASRALPGNWIGRVLMAAAIAAVIAVVVVWWR
jgi:hypothetical protein